jgi:hypothetical protein
VRKRPAASPGLSHSGMVAFGIDAIAAIPMRCARASPFETTTSLRSFCIKRKRDVDGRNKSGHDVRLA